MEHLSSIDPQEVAKFARLADEWWDPKGAFAPLHKLNPVRLRFLRDVAAEHFGRDKRTRRAFAGLSLLDIGCGGGLLSEPMARLGFEVMGCDAAEENVHAAEAHATRTGVEIEYRHATAEGLAQEALSLDVLLAMEIVEHVSDVAEFLASAAKLLRPGGLLFVATIDRTLKSLALAKFAAEYVLRWVPAGTHDWNRFIRPAELRTQLESTGLTIVRTIGMEFDPLARDWHLSQNTDVNYAMAATR